MTLKLPESKIENIDEYSEGKDSQEDNQAI